MQFMMEGGTESLASPIGITSVLPCAHSHLKRYRGSPTGQTPTQPRKSMPACLPFSARKKLDFSMLQRHRGPLEWSNEENVALVEFLCFHNH